MCYSECYIKCYTYDATPTPRLIVPAALRSAIGRREITKSLRTSSVRVARRRAAVWEIHIHRLYAAARGAHTAMTREELDRLTLRYLATSFEELGFYPVPADGLIRAENARSRRATLRRMRGLWNRSR